MAGRIKSLAAEFAYALWLFLVGCCAASRAWRTSWMPWMVPWWRVVTWALSWQWRRCPTGEASVGKDWCVGAGVAERGGGLLYREDRGDEGFKG
jgi:hypothetical protein